MAEENLGTTVVETAGRVAQRVRERLGKHFPARPLDTRPTAADLLARMQKMTDVEVAEMRTALGPARFEEYVRSLVREADRRR